MQVPILVAVTARVQLLIKNSTSKTMTNTLPFKKCLGLAKGTHQNPTNYLNNPKHPPQLSTNQLIAYQQT